MRRGWVILFGLLLLVAIPHTLWTACSQSEFEERVEAIRQAGEPLVLAELNRDPVPPSMDGAPPLRRMVAHYRSSGFPGDFVPEEFDQGLLEEADIAKLRSWSERMEPAFDWIEEASRKPSWDFGVDWTNGVKTRVDSIVAMHMAADYLEWRACLDGSPEAAIESATLLFDLARKLERPSVISCMVRWRVEITACEILQRCAARRALVTGDGMHERLRRAEDPGGVREALLGERVMCLALIQEWARGETSPLLAIRGVEQIGVEPDRTALDALAVSPLCRPLAYGDGVRALRMFEDVLRLETLPTWEAIEQVEGFDELHNHGVPWVFSTLWRVLPGKMFVERARHLATLRVTDAALSVLAWRRERGAWPVTLADVGEWVDPFTGEPLIYAPEQDGGMRVEARWWAPHEDDPDQIEFMRDDGEDIAWILEAR